MFTTEVVRVVIAEGECESTIEDIESRRQSWLVSV